MVRERLKGPDLLTAHLERPRVGEDHRAQASPLSPKREDDHRAGAGITQGVRPDEATAEGVGTRITRTNVIDKGREGSELSGRQSDESVPEWAGDGVDRKIDRTVQDQRPRIHCGGIE